MSVNSSPLARLWRRLFSSRPKSTASIPARPVRLESETSSRPLPRRPERHGGIEPLEGRIAPAVLLPGGRDLSYTDLSGDKITVHFSSPIFAGESGAALNSALDKVFVFSTGDAHSGDTTPQDLQRIDLTKAPLSDSFVNKASGLSLSVTVTAPATGSSQLVNVGAIEATDLALGSIFIQGDLGHLTAGSSKSALAVQSLHLESLGQVRTSQAGTASYLSTISGGVGMLTIGTINDARIDVTTAQSFGTPLAIGNIGIITLGHAGTPLADAMIGGATTDSASIIAAGNIGSIHVTGNLHGGAGSKSAAISCGGNIGSVAVAGKLLGGAGVQSASIQSGKAMGAVTLLNPGGHVLEGGAGSTSGDLLSGTSMGPVTIRGSIAGGDGDQSARILSGGTLGSISIAGDVIGGAGAQSGLIGAVNLGKVTITGQLKGGGGTNSATIAAAFGGQGTLGTLFIGKGIVGGAGQGSSDIDTTGAIGSVVIGADPATGIAMQGGTGAGSAVIDANGSIGSVLLRGSLAAIGNTIVAPSTTPSGDGDESAGISSGGVLGRVQVLGSVTGSPTAVHSGYLEGELGIGTVGITGHLLGGGTHSGVVASGGSISSVTVGSYLQGGAYAFSGSIQSGWSGHGTLGAVTISGAVLGGAGANSGSIQSGGALGVVQISTPGASTSAAGLQGGAGASSGSVYAAGSIVSVLVNGAITGGGGAHSGSVEGHGIVGSVQSMGLAGGSGDYSGSVLGDDFLHGAAVGRANLVSLDLGAITGGAGQYSGSILSETGIGTLHASELTRGSSGTSASIRTGIGTFGTGGAQSLQIAHLGQTGGAPGGTLEIHGALGRLTSSEIVGATVHATTIGVVATGTLSSSTLTALGSPGQTTGSDLAIAQILVSGSVSGTKILAGYGLDGAAANGHAQIGSVTVHGNWSASDLVAGTRDPSGDGFGNSDDAAIPLTSQSPLLSRITSVVIGGTVSGDSSSASYGFEAESIGQFSYGSTTLPLTPAGGQVFVAAPHVSVREVAVPAVA